MKLSDEWFVDEVRDGFYIPAMIKLSWGAQLEVLEAFSNICESHHFHWIAAYGTLLGAVRHGGFIPWDDDIDVFMPRNDLDRFLEAAPDILPEGFAVFEPISMERVSLCWTVDNWNRYLLPPERWKQSRMYPFSSRIEIFPLDTVLSDKHKEALRENEMRLIYRALVCLESLRSGKRANDMQKKLEQTLSQLRSFHLKIDRNQPLRKQLLTRFDELCRLSSDAVPGGSDQVVNYPQYISGQDQPFCFEWLSGTARAAFETIEVPIPMEYDRILTGTFGDWKVPCKGNLTHDYPNFGELEAALEEDMDGKWPFSYTVTSGKDIEPERMHPFRQIRALLSRMKAMHALLQQNAQTNNTDICAEILALCQTMAQRLGDVLEEKYDCAEIIRELEQYCEQVFQIYALMIPEQYMEET